MTYHFILGKWFGERINLIHSFWKFYPLCFISFPFTHSFLPSFGLFEHLQCAFFFFFLNIVLHIFFNNFSWDCNNYLTFRSIWNQFFSTSSETYKTYHNINLFILPILCTYIKYWYALNFIRQFYGFCSQP